MRARRGGGCYIVPDFSDGAVACQGRDMGGATFASFDRDALRLSETLGYSTLCP